MENIKVCTKCGRELPLECFNKCKSSKDCLQYYCKECQKQYYAEHKEDRKQYNAEHKEERAAYGKQYYAKRYDTIEGYAYAIRYRNLQADRESGRCGENEDILPPLDYYIEKFTLGIDYYDGKRHHWRELGFDRIDDSKPHTVDNIVLATTFHNKDKWNKRMSVEQYRDYIQNQLKELNLVLN